MAGLKKRLARLAGITIAVTSGVLTSVSVAAASPPDITPFVIGGSDANIADHPFLVALTDADGDLWCGGNLIAPDKVLTAAHCTEDIVSNPELIRVVSGRTKLSGSEGTVSTVTKIWVHGSADISVLTLSAPVSQKPIELAKADDPGYIAGTNATVVGWGDTGDGGISDTLQKATVPVTSDAYCGAAYPGHFKPASEVCAGYEMGGIDTCQGDSGGPLVAGTKLIGLTSWGAGCALPGKPGVYARVGPFYNDIQAQLS